MNLFRHQGVVLISCLMIVTLITMLGISGMEIALMQLKINHYHKLARELADFTDKQLQQIENTFDEKSTSTCLYSPKLASYFFNQSAMAWKNSKVCQASSQKFELYYLIERLQDNPCLQILIQDEKKNIFPYAAIYYRLTLLGQSKNLQVSTIQQSVFTKPGKRLPLCNKKPLLVSLGRQSWREKTEC